MLTGYGLWKWIQLTKKVGVCIIFGRRPRTKGRWYIDLLPTLNVWRHQLQCQHTQKPDNLYGVEMIWLSFTIFRIDIEILS